MPQVIALRGAWEREPSAADHLGLIVRYLEARFGIKRGATSQSAPPVTTTAELDFAASLPRRAAPKYLTPEEYLSKREPNGS